MTELKLRHILAIVLVELAVTLGFALLITSAGGQELDETAQPDWRRPFIAPGTSFTTGTMDVYRQPDGSTGYGTENGGAYIYRDRQGSAQCTDTAGLVTCLGSPDPDPAGFLDEPR